MGFLKNTLAAALIAGAGVVGYNALTAHDHTSPRIVDQQENITRVLTDGLAGQYVGDFQTRAMLGIRGKIPDTLSIDYEKRLQASWRAKSLNNKDITPVAVQTGKQLIQAYGESKRTPMTLDHLIEHADSRVEQITNNLDWSKVSTIKRLTPIQLEAVKDISNQIDGDDLITYSMTELTPRTDGQRNKELYEVMLAGGLEFVGSFPAMGDEKTSFGMYQHTEYAVFDMGDNKRGASIINQALPTKYKIPGSVAKLSIEQQHDAAALFAINNFADAIKNIPDDEVQYLQENLHKHHKDLVTYMAVSHHAPTPTRRAFIRWVHNKMKQPLEQEISRNKRHYAVKSSVNYDALQGLPGFTQLPNNSKGYAVHKHTVTDNISPQQVQHRFNLEDTKDWFSDDARVVNSQGKELETIMQGTDVYILSKHHKKRF
jgi:hypothetical protein